MCAASCSPPPLRYTAMPRTFPIIEESGLFSAGLQPPSQLYAASKLIGEAVCARYAKSHGVQFNALRFASVYGERQHARAVNAVFVATGLRPGSSRRSPGDRGRRQRSARLCIRHGCGGRLACSRCTAHRMATRSILPPAVDTTATQVAEMALRLCGRSDLQPPTPRGSPVGRSAAGTRLGFSSDRAAREIGLASRKSIMRRACVA